MAILSAEFCSLCMSEDEDEAEWNTSVICKYFLSFLTRYKEFLNALNPDREEDRDDKELQIVMVAIEMFFESFP